jgi:hypothetical protein
MLAPAAAAAAAVASHVDPERSPGHRSQDPLRGSGTGPVPGEGAGACTTIVVGSACDAEASLPSELLLVRNTPPAAPARLVPLRGCSARGKVRREQPRNLSRLVVRFARRCGPSRDAARWRASARALRRRCLWQELPHIYAHGLCRNSVYAVLVVGKDSYRILSPFMKIGSDEE